MSRLNILYGIEQESRLEERCLDHLEGYAGSKPVRVGNAAADRRDASGRRPHRQKEAYHEQDVSRPEEKP